MKKAFSALIVTFFVLSVLILPGCNNSSGKETIVVYNWGEYISDVNDTYTLDGQEYILYGCGQGL